MATTLNKTEDEITREVLAQYEDTPDPRLRRIMTALVRHLHELVREVELTEGEWFKAIDYLTRAGQTCTDTRQEFILLSDVLGVSMLVDLINHRKPAGITESTVLGPFFSHGAPEFPYGGNIAPKDPGIPTFFYGRIIGPDGIPIGGAVLDVWQTGSDGFYDVQKSGTTEPHMRGRFRSEPDGAFLVRTVRPVSYPSPLDGPVGELMRAASRQPKRPAHTHFMVTAPGYETLITHLFDAVDEHLSRDPVFAVKDSLVCSFSRHDEPVLGRDFGVPPPFYTLERDFVMEPAAEGKASAGPSWGARSAA
jgi:hydroxyquinol 1,2-dioxygenase